MPEAKRAPARHLRAVDPGDVEVGSAPVGPPHSARDLYDRFGPDVHRLVRRILGSDADCEDVVHEVFLHVFRGYARVRDPEALRGWVLTLAVNIVRKELRRRYSRRRALARFFWEPSPTARGDDYEATDLMRRTYAILNQLPPDERLAFCLRHLEQHRLTEVAVLCDCSLATTKRRLERARTRFLELSKADPLVASRIQWDSEESSDG